jgi:hypothetical protein
MRKKRLFLILAAFLIAVLNPFPEICIAWEREACNEIKTSLGRVRVIRHVASLPPNIITVNGKTVFRSKGTYAFLYKSFRTSSYVAVLFGENDGGSATPVDTLYFILLKSNRKPVIVTDKDFYSADGTMKIRQEKDDVFIDLGFEAKKRKTAILRSGEVTVQQTPVDAFPMELKDCQWLYESSFRECTQLRELKLDCEQFGRKYSGGCVAVMTGITALSNHPGFVSSALGDICVTVCKTGEVVPFEQFKKTVCSIK